MGTGPIKERNSKAASMASAGAGKALAWREMEGPTWDLGGALTELAGSESRGSRVWVGLRGIWEGLGG